MPWHIKQEDSKPSGGEAQIHFVDSKIKLHMIVSLLNGAADLYIGADDIEDSKIYIDIDASCKNAVEVVHVTRPSLAEIRHITRALTSLGTNENVVSIIRSKLQRQAKKGRKRSLSLDEKVRAYEIYERSLLKVSP